MAERDALTDWLSAARRIGGGPGGNIPLNAAISSYLDVQKARRGKKRLEDVTRLLAQAEPGTLPGLEGEASELATMALGPEAGIGTARAFAGDRGARADQRRQAEAMGQYLGFSNAPVSGTLRNSPMPGAASLSFENISTQPQGQMTLTQFMQAPQQIFQAETTKRANEQALLREQTKSALQLQRQMALERFKANTKNKNPTSLKDLTPNEIKQMVQAVSAGQYGGEDVTPQQAFDMIYGADIPIGAREKAQEAEKGSGKQDSSIPEGLSPEAQEVWKQINKGKK